MQIEAGEDLPGRIESGRRISLSANILLFVVRIGQVF